MWLNRRLRKEKEILYYLDEAFDKVWLMRTHPCNDKEIEERRQQAVERILNDYPECENGFDDWQCGYWNGVLSTLRWVLMDDKDNLDT